MSGTNMPSRNNQYRSVLKEFRDELFNKEDLEHERRFDAKSLPLLLIALTAGYIYSQTHQDWAAAIAACFMLVYALYFVINRTIYIVRLVRGDKISKTSKPYNQTISQSTKDTGERLLSKIVDNDHIYAIIGGYVVPIAGNALLIIYSATHAQWALWSMVPLAVLYIAYWLLTLIVSINRKLIKSLSERDIRLHEASRRMAIMQRDNEIASRTHDTVTGGLSYIAFTAQQTMETLDRNSDEYLAWSKIEATAQQTLDNVHAVIDILSSPSAGTTAHSSGQSTESPVDATTLETSLQSRLTAGDDRLHDLGFRGSSIMSGDFTSTTKTTLDECASLIDELYTNIASHGAEHCYYRILITADNGRIVITQTNETGPAANANYARSFSGRGLGLHRKTIEHLGGELKASIENDQWMLQARLPM